MARRCGAGHVINLIDFEEDREGHIVSNQLEVRSREQVCDIRLLCSEEVIQTEDVMPLVHKPFAHMRAQKACAARYQNPKEFCHWYHRIRGESSVCYQTLFGKRKKQLES